MTTATRYTPGQLSFYADGLGSELAADKASRLIAELAADKASRLIAEAVDAGYVVYGGLRLDLGLTHDAETVAGLIASAVDADFPEVGANDTASRERIFSALTGENIAADGWKRAELVAGVDGWGILREPAGIAPLFWVNLGRSFHGPFDTIEEAAALLDAEEAGGEAIVIAGTKPVGSCKPDGRHIWATRTFDDGAWTFTKFNGWLIAEETTTTSAGMASMITDIYKAEIE